MSDGVGPATRGAAVLIVAAMVAAGALAAFTPPTPSTVRADDEDPYADAVEAWDFTGFNGSAQFTSDEVGFVDFAFPITESLDEDDVNLKVTFTWTGPRYEDQEQPWVCLYWGLQTPDDTEFDPLSLASCGYYQGEGTQEISLGVGDVEVEHAWVHPVCRVFECFRDERSLEVDSRRIFAMKPFEKLLDNHDRPVGHLFAMAGGMHPFNATVEASWENTVVSISTLPPDGTFVHFAEDFETDAHVRADNKVWPGWSPMYQRGAVLEADLGDIDAPFFMMFNGFGPYFEGVACCTDHDAGYERPDGTMVPGHWFEISSKPGTWTFWDDEQLSDRADYPAVMGGPVDWAEMPWDDA